MAISLFIFNQGPSLGLLAFYLMILDIMLVYWLCILLFHLDSYERLDKKTLTHKSVIT